MTTTTKNGTSTVIIPSLNILTATLVICSDTPLIINRWSGKAKDQMRAKHSKAPKQAKEARDQHRDYRESLYQMEGPKGTPAYNSPDKKTGKTKAHKDFGSQGFGVKAISLKLAAVRGAKACGVHMTTAKAGFHVIGMGAESLVRIDGDKPYMREDAVRNQTGVADLRYRGCFENWSITFDVRYNERAFSLDQIVNFFNTAGFCNGIGEWRPEKSGEHGMFHVKQQPRQQRRGMVRLG